MFKVIFFVSLIIITCGGQGYSQEDNLVCTPETGETWNGQIGGKLLPSDGTLKVLFVFAQFAQDNFPISSWPTGQPPSDMQSWVDQTWSSTPTGDILDYTLL